MNPCVMILMFHSGESISLAMCLLAHWHLFLAIQFGKGEFYPRVHIIWYQGQPSCLGVVGLMLMEYVAVCILALGLATSCIYCFLMLGSSTSGSFGAIGSISSWISSTVFVSDFQSDHWSFA